MANLTTLTNEIKDTDRMLRLIIQHRLVVIIGNDNHFFVGCDSEGEAITPHRSEVIEHSTAPLLTEQETTPARLKNDCRLLAIGDHLEDTIIAAINAKNNPCQVGPVYVGMNDEAHPNTVRGGDLRSTRQFPIQSRRHRGPSW